ncbi:UNVERIFIED_CONTAM: pilus assembly protein Flp/PilA [Acetivibrio alkalicellulosi]
MSILKKYKSLFKKQKGQGLVEYAFIIIFIAMAAFFALGYLGTSVIHFFNYLISLL